MQCANALRKLGLHRGDIIVLMAPNHIDLCVPYYAALYLGIVVAPIDRTLTVSEYKYQSIYSHSFKSILIVLQIFEEIVVKDALGSLHF